MSLSSVMDPLVMPPGCNGYSQSNGPTDVFEQIRGVIHKSKKLLLWERDREGGGAVDRCRMEIKEEGRRQQSRCIYMHAWDCQRTKLKSGEQGPL